MFQLHIVWPCFSPHTPTHPCFTSPLPRTEDVDKLRDQLDLYISEKGELQQTLEIAQKDLEMLMSKDSGAEGGCGYGVCVGGVEGGLNPSTVVPVDEGC